MTVRLMDVVSVVGAVAAVLAALFGYFNGREIGDLRGRLEATTGVLTEHVSTPGLHR